MAPTHQRCTSSAQFPLPQCRSRTLRPRQGSNPAATTSPAPFIGSRPPHTHGLQRFIGATGFSVGFTAGH